MEPLVSIIIPAYNVEKYIGSCLQSCVSQTYVNIEIIIINDGSTDTTPDILADWAQKDERIQVIHQENGGMSKARNLGLELSEGELIVFLDSDDLLSVDAIGKLVQAWDGDSDSIISCGYRRFYDDEVINNKKGNLKPSIVSHDLFLHNRRGYYCWGIAFPIQLLQSIKQPFDESMRNLEDVAWLSVVLLYVDKIYFVDAPLYHYRVTPKSMTSNSKNVRWQIKCWFSALDSIERSIKDRPLCAVQQKEIKKRIQMCKNNVFAELYVAGLGWSDYIEIYQSCRKDSIGKVNMLLLRIEFQVYQCILKFKKLKRDR